MQGVLHSHNVPADHVCVMLTTANTAVKAPLVLGDPEENETLDKNKVFAFPNTSLCRASLGSNKSISLVPYL